MRSHDRAARINQLEEAVEATCGEGRAEDGKGGQADKPRDVGAESGGGKNGR